MVKIMKKIVIYNDRWCSGGVESMIINLLLNGDFSKFDIYLLVGVKETNIYDEMLNKLNIHFITILPTTYNPIVRDLKILKKLKNYIKEIKPDIVHINTCNTIGFKYSKIIKKHSKAKIIVHSHNTKIEKDKFKIKYLLHMLMKHYEKFIDYRLACSKAAGMFLFSKPFEVLKNGVDLDRFKFDANVRCKIRKELNISDQEITLINIGRFSSQKNQLFLIDVLSKLDTKYKLLLIGEGENKQLIEEKIMANKLQERVTILPPTKNIENYYSASDCFLLPSLHEGLPVVGVEAQANGINCIFSNTITNEIIISPNCVQLPINDINIWVKTIQNTTFDRNDNKNILNIGGYNIKSSANKLIKLYMDL